MYPLKDKFRAAYAVGANPQPSMYCDKEDNVSVSSFYGLPLGCKCMLYSVKS